MAADKCSSLPDYLLVDIFQRLETTAVIRSAGTCRPWRHVIIDNASRLRPRPDRFLPHLLYGFLDKDLICPRWLKNVPASNTALPSLFTPANGIFWGISVDGRLYNNLLSSRDGLLLLGEKGRENLCLCTTLTGICKVLPTAAFDNDSTTCIYVLATSYDVPDDGDGDGDTAVWILGVDCQWDDVRDGTTYQIFSSRTAAWGPVKRSAKLPEDLAAYVYNYNTPSPCLASASMVVCHGAVSWFVGLVPHRDAENRRRRRRMCIFSLDPSTGQTWTTDVPSNGPAVLALSEEGKLSVVKMLPSSHQIRVWVLDGDGEWTLRRTMAVGKLFPDCHDLQLSGFCPRSGYLFGTGRDDRNLLHDFLIGIDGSSPRLIGRVDSKITPIRFAFEMDCATYMSSYISKMKYF